MTKTILLLGAGQEQCIAIEEARALGYRVVAADGSAAAPGLKLADVGVQVDIRDVAALTELGRAQQISGLFCHAVEIPDVVSEVAQALGLPGLTPETARRCTHKNSRIAALKAAGIPVADFAVAHDRNELAAIAPVFGFPLVLKPVNNAGSRGVQLVKGVDMLLAAYDEAMLYSRSPIVLIEQYLCGPQISTESVVCDGRVHTFAFADRNYANEDFYAPYFIEDGINFPTVLSDDVQSAVHDLVNRTIAALGINMGAAKGDIIVYEGVPYIIEMASRTSGGWFGAGSIPKATGVNPLKPLLQMCMGEQPDLNALKPTRNLGCAQRYWIPQRSSVFHSASGFEAVQQMPGVEMFNAFFPAVGTRLEKAQHHAQRHAQVICTADTREEAIRRADAAIAAIRVEQTFQP
jgi:biotin carboxylase